jgi:hypothetical protein
VVPARELSDGRGLPLGPARCRQICWVSLPFQNAGIDDRPPIHSGLRRVLFCGFWQDPWLFQAGEALQGLRHLLAAAGGCRDHVDHGEGRVEVSARLQLLDRHAGRGQGLGAHLLLVNGNQRKTSSWPKILPAADLAAEPEALNTEL